MRPLDCVYCSLISHRSVRSLPTLVGLPCRPVEWIKKWFLRKRKADGNNVAPTPPVPTFVENEPPAHGSQVLGHAHSKFWSMDAFVAADSTNFSPSVGYIPKFYGHRKHSVPPGIRGDCTTDSRENREAREIFPPGASTGTGYGYASPSDSVLTCGCVETATPTTCDPREALLGADAVVGHFSSANDDTLGFPCEHLSGTLTVDDPASTALLPAAASPERSTYIDNLYDEGYSGSEGASDFGFDLTNYSVSVSSPLDMIDDFILASKDLDFVSATTEDFELGALDPTTGHVGLDSSSPSSSDGPDDMTKILGEHSALYESLLMQITNQDPMGDTVNWIDSRDLLGTDDYLGAGADHFFFVLVGFEFYGSTHGHQR